MNRKFVLVTGCSEGGIGYAFVHSFLNQGYHVFATARTLSKMGPLGALTNVTLLPLDVSDPASIAAVVDIVQKTTAGKLDCLEGRSLFEVNFWAVLALTQAFAPLLIAARGVVVNIGSIAGRLHGPWAALYSASKAALEVASETLRLELAPFSVRVIISITGAVQTNIMIKAAKQCSLPSTSAYHPAGKEIMIRAKGDDFTKKTRAAVYTDMVVNEVISNTNGKIWKGEMAGLIRFVSTCLPQALLDMVLSYDTGLKDL
ncbi:hypothetical protein G7054_g10914 [Neopestalotiopsis clavispora]|nr:hypothetical protein G7054_g10914 [Neopestalotiopsis clavispora]